MKWPVLVVRASDCQQNWSALRKRLAATGTSAALVAGTLVVAEPLVKTDSIIFLTAQSTGGTAGALRVSARTAGVSFTITSSSATDTSTVGWMIVNP